MARPEGSCHDTWVAPSNTATAITAASNTASRSAAVQVLRKCGVPVAGCRSMGDECNRLIHSCASRMALRRRAASTIRGPGREKTFSSTATTSGFFGELTKSATT